MDKVVTCLVLLTSFLFAIVEKSMADVDELARIKRNYRTVLLSQTETSDSLAIDFVNIEPEKEMSDQVVIELHQRYPFDLCKIRNYLLKMRLDGSWSDINYQDTKRSGWEPKIHAERILELAKLYYTEGTDFYQSTKLKEAIHRALNYWFAAKLECRNWWYNEIGVPKTLGAAFILLEEQLSVTERNQAVGVMSRAEFGMTGQNKVWLAANVLVRALLQDDELLARAARDTIVSEICFGKKEGIQSDWSFHQHGSQLQFGNYGLSYVLGMSFFYKIFQGTSYELNQSQTFILHSLINEGYKWVIWNRYMDISSLGRQLFHHAQIHKGYGTALAAADLGLGGFPKKGNLLIGHKHFDNSDYTVHRSKNWMGTVKMSSGRVIGTELVNEDNLKGYYLGDGATYFYTQGDEYLDVFPFWDWRKIPGVTAYEDVAPLPNVKMTKSNNKSFLVGGLSDGKCGMSAMKLERDGLTAYKSWLFMDDFVVCLGAGIKSDTSLCVTTSIDQCVKKDDLWFLNEKGWTKINGKKVVAAKEMRFFHNNTGYVIIDSDTLVAEEGERTGRWCDFMKMYTPDTVKGQIVSLHLRHGVRPQNGSYQYLVFPNIEKKQLEHLSISGKMKVIRNDAEAQIVSVNNRFWIVAYHRININLNGLAFSPEYAGIYCVEQTEKGLEKRLEVKFEKR